MEARKTFRLAFKIFNWATLVLAVFTVLLVLKRSPAPEIPADPQAAERFKTKMAEVAEARSQHRPAELKLQAAELNAWLQPNLATDPTGSGVKDIQVELVDDRARAYMVVNLYGKDFSMVLEGRPGISGGYLTFEATGGKVGSLSLPQSALAGAIRRMFEAPENHENLRIPPEITGLRVQNGELVVAFK
jgi:hypothetical protein